MKNTNEVIISGELFKKTPTRKFDKLTVGGGLLSVKNNKINNYIGFKVFNEVADVLDNLNIGDEVSCTGYLKTETFNNQYKLVLILKTIVVVTKGQKEELEGNFDPDF